jgi:amino acid adenylation domain-containing protein
VEALSARFAGALQAAGVRRGDRVALVLENSVEFVAAMFGTLMAGGIVVPLNPTVKHDRLEYVLDDCSVRAVVSAAPLAREVARAVADAATVPATLWVDDVAAAPGGPRAVETPVIDVDLAAIMYTSGSTGRPRGVMLEHRTVRHNAWSIATYLENRPDDVVMCVLPLSFGYGLFQVLVAALVGHAVVLERSFAFPVDVLRRIGTHGVTGFPAVPTIFATLIRTLPLPDLDLGSVRYLTNAAAALPPAHVERLAALFPTARFYAMYGQTECTRISYLEPHRVRDKIGSVGRAIPNTEAWVVDGAGRPAAPGEVGELVVRGSSLMRGYWGDSTETARKLRDGPMPGEKVLYTGDRFRTDDEGFLYFVGRSDDIFKSKGEKVAPQEIENVLYELDAVAEAAVVGVPDDVDGMAVKAVIVVRDGASLGEREVRAHCRARLESHLVPKTVEIRTSLPKTDNGKIKKTALV